MIEKCEKEGLFNSQKYKLPAQYYALIEIGGAYAYKFIPFINFLGIPCLILTDIDSMIDGRTKSVVSKGKTTSNVTIKWWMRKLKNISEKDKISLTDIIALKYDEKQWINATLNSKQKNKDCAEDPWRKRLEMLTVHIMDYQRRRLRRKLSLTKKARLILH